MYGIRSILTPFGACHCVFLDNQHHSRPVYCGVRWSFGSRSRRRSPRSSAGAASAAALERLARPGGVASALRPASAAALERLARPGGVASDLVPASARRQLAANTTLLRSSRLGRTNLLGQLCKSIGRAFQGSEVIAPILSELVVNGGRDIATFRVGAIERRQQYERFGDDFAFVRRQIVHLPHSTLAHAVTSSAQSPQRELLGSKSRPQEG